MAQDEKELSAEFKDGYKKGIESFFNYLSVVMANHYHYDQNIDKVCQRENEWLMDIAESALEELSPESHLKFIEIEKLINENRILKEQLKHI
jgi:hypothetical protein